MTNEFNGKFGVGLNPWINMKVELLRNKTELKTAGPEQSMKPMIGKSIDQSITIDAN